VLRVAPGGGFWSPVAGQRGAYPGETRARESHGDQPISLGNSVLNTVAICCWLVVTGNVTGTMEFY